MSKLDINSEMAAFDGKDRAFYEGLSEEDKKKFTNFLMIRWGSCVIGSTELQTYYLMSVNQKLNKRFFDVSDTNHKQLNWLAATTVSPGMGNHRHQWLAGPKKKTANTKVGKFLELIYPEMDGEDIALMEQLNTVADCKKHAEALGWTKEQIKKTFG